MTMSVISRTPCRFDSPTNSAGLPNSVMAELSIPKTSRQDCGPRERPSTCALSSIVAGLIPLLKLTRLGPNVTRVRGRVDMRSQRCFHEKGRGDEEDECQLTSTGARTREATSRMSWQTAALTTSYRRDESRNLAAGCRWRTARTHPRAGRPQRVLGCWRCTSHSTHKPLGP